jgi:hypothetical protein
MDMTQKTGQITEIMYSFLCKMTQADVVLV